jgi:thiamine pyrophosphate-dependent acetolactate synthase large subunit-like protein
MVKKSTSKSGRTQSNENGVSRRDFLTKATAAGTTAGIAAAALGANNTASANTGTNASKPEILVPDDITASLAEEPIAASFEGQGMSGNDVFVKACKDEGLKAMFCCPGNYGMINAFAQQGIPCYGGRTEDAMCAAADGFARVTGEVAATSGTEGPGFTNMIMGIASANAARSPILVVASNKTISEDDREGFIQQAYQQPTTEGMKKYGKRLIDPLRTHEYAATAFRQLKTGVPGPVHLDFPGEVGGARHTDSAELRDYYDKSQYRTESKAHPDPRDIEKAADLIKKSERPMIVAGQGVFYHKGWEDLKRTAERNDIAVVESGPSRGHFGDAHRLSANFAPDTLGSVDLVIFVGQYCMPSVGEYRFGPDVKTIRVHPEGGDLGRNWPLDLGIISDEQVFLALLADILPKRTRDMWTAELAASRAKFDKENDHLYAQGLKHSQSTDLIHPAVWAKELGDFLYEGDIPKEQTSSVIGGWTVSKFTRRFTKAFRPGQLVNGPYQYYAIGPDVGFTVGVGAAMQMGVGPQAPYKGAPVVTTTGDAGIAYTIMEMDTLRKYNIPSVIIVYNNNAWGVWNAGSNSRRAQHMYLFQENLRYDKIAEALGCRGEYVTSPEEFTPALERSYKMAAAEGVSTLINCQGKKEFSSARDYAPGTPRPAEPGATAFAH